MLLLPIFGCLSCNPELRSAILEHRFWLLVATVVPVTLVGGFLAAWAAAAISRRAAGGSSDARDVGAVPWAVALIGAGLGALFDGILFHQILQVHDMVSNSLPPTTLEAKGVNVFWSGIFHMAVFALILTGVAALWHRLRRRDAPPSAAVFWGSLAFGWGAFNLFDTLTFHAILRYHDLVDVGDAQWAWNLGWAIFGCVVAAVGAAALWHGLRSLRSTTRPT
jgi:uncharacterized membrane protein